MDQRARASATAPSLLAPLLGWRCNRLYAAFLALVALRVALFAQTPAAAFFAARPEVSTPLNSAAALLEGVFYAQRGIPLYSGSAVHHPPLLVLVAAAVLQPLPAEAVPWALFALALAADWCVAIALIRLARWKQRAVDQSETWAVAPEESRPAGVPPPLFWDPVAAGCAYLALPFSVAGCVGLTTAAVPAALALLGLSWAAGAGNLRQTAAAGALVAAGAYVSLSYAPLIAVLFLLVRRRWRSVAVMAAVISWSALVAWGAWASGDAGASFAETIGIRFTAADLAPNPGVYWYFFAEVFDEFRALFLYVFGMLPVAFVLPLAVRFRARPLFVAFLILALAAALGAYPSAGETGVALALLLLHPEVLAYMRFKALAATVLVTTTALMPAVFHAWVHWKSGNANFYYGVALAGALAQILLIMDALIAHTRRDVFRCNPVYRRERVLLENVQ